MKKTVRNLFLSVGTLAMCASVSGCSSVKGATYTAGTPIKIGLICLHDSASTYDANFINSMNEAVSNLGSKVETVVTKTGIPESKECYDACKDLVKQGCNFIFCDSFGHQDFIIKAAKKWPSVIFGHATGTNAKTAKLSNYFNAFASIYEGRYLAGVAAGARLKADIELGKVTSKYMDGGNVKLGYVGAYPYAEVMSGYTSWFLGVKSQVNNVVMDVTFTNSWYDQPAEQAGAQTLIDKGCYLISQHADSMGAPGACETARVYNTSYNISTQVDCYNTFLSYSRINWAPCFENVINTMYASGNDAVTSSMTDYNWTGSFNTGSVVYGLSTNSYLIDQDIKDAVATAEAGIKDGSIKVFDCSKFTVGGVTLTTYMGDTDGDYAGDTEVITTDSKTGITYFNESYYCSAPYFNVEIDGITKLN